MSFSLAVLGPEAGFLVLPLEEQVQHCCEAEAVCVDCFAECKWCETAATVLIGSTVLTVLHKFSPFPFPLLPVLYFINLILFLENFCSRRHSLWTDLFVLDLFNCKVLIAEFFAAWAGFPNTSGVIWDDEAYKTFSFVLFCNFFWWILVWSPISNFLWCFLFLNNYANEQLNEASFQAGGK